MKKSLIAIAIATALSSPQINAKTTLYGQVNQVISQVDGINYGADDTSTTRIHDDGDSLFGIKGAEDLGNGLSALFQVEFNLGLNGGESDQTSPTSGGTNGTGSDHAFAVGNAFVGLTGGFGTLKLGRMDTPAKVALDEISNMIIGGVHGADNTIGIGYVSAGTSNNVLAYVSPDMNGLTFALASVAGEKDDVAGSSDVADGLAEGLSTALMYNQGPFYGAVAYTDLSQELLGEDDGTDILGVGLKYAPGPWGVGYMYEKTASALGGSYLPDKTGGALSLATADEYQSHLLVGNYEFGNNQLSVKYGFGKFNDDADTERSTYGVGFAHNFSKRTLAYAAYSAAEDKNAAQSYDSSIFSLGLNHTF